MSADAPLFAAILVFDAVEELDFVGPLEVLGMAQKGGLPVLTRLVAATRDPVFCAKGLRVIPDHGFEDCPPVDLLIVPGGQGTRPGVNDPRLVGWIAEVGGKARIVASVCTGAALIGKAGLANGKRLTTYWAAMDFVAANAPDSVLVRDERVVTDGDVISGAGVSAGIDMTLVLVGRLWGEDAARTVQKNMEYYPEPPFGGRHPVTGAQHATGKQAS